MKTFTNISGALALSTTALFANTALAQNLENIGLKPGYVTDDAQLGFFVRTLRQTELNDGTLVLERRVIDAAMMLSCEWRVVAKRKQPESEPMVLSNPQKMHAQCRPMVARSGPVIGQVITPEKTEAAHEGRAILFKHPVRQEIGKPDIIYESHESINSDNIITLMKRAWHVASEKVCLYTSEGIRSEQETRFHFHHDWGCHPVTNQRHFKAVQQAIGISSPL